jgi:uncharacterized protein (DUF4415 family)
MLVKGSNMRKVQAEPYRNIDFSRGKRGAVITPAPGKTKISIRLDNAVLDHFRTIVETAGGGNYQSLINDALAAHIHQQSLLAALRKVVREELAHVATADEASKPGMRRLEDVIGCVEYRGRTRPVAEMERAIFKGVKARAGRGR